MIEQTGFSSVRPTGDHHGHAIAQQTALSGGGLQDAHALPQRDQARRDDAIG